MITALSCSSGLERDLAIECFTTHPAIDPVVVEDIGPHPATNKEVTRIAARTAAVLLSFMMLISPPMFHNIDVVIVYAYWTSICSNLFLRNHLLCNCPYSAVKENDAQLRNI